MAEAAIVKEFKFTWEGVDRKGSKIRGNTLGANEDAVKVQLRKQGINPIRVRREFTIGSGKKAIIPQDIAIFARQMATMMQAGLPLVQALEIVGKGHENPSMGEMILGIKLNIEGGGSFAESLGKYPHQFDDLFVNLVDAGEKSGTLDKLLDKIATYKEKTEALKKKVKKALTYPAAVIVVAFVVTGILLYFVIPQFEGLFKGFGADLPAFTLFVIGLSKFVQSYWWLILMWVVGLVVGFGEGKKRSRAFRRLLDRVMLRLPIVGVILDKSAVARYHRTLSTMFSAGVPLVEAMDSVARAAGNIVFEEGIMTIKDQIATGTQLNFCMQQSGLFPPMAVQMVAIGEESGALDTMCGKVADYYEAEVDALVDALTSLLEPMIMSFLGVVVGGLVVAMYLPIFKLGQAI